VRQIFFEKGRRGYDTAVRSQALKLLLSLSTLTEEDISDVIKSSTNPWNTDYNAFIQSRMSDVARSNSKIRLELISLSGGTWRGKISSDVYVCVLQKPSQQTTARKLLVSLLLCIVIFVMFCWFCVLW
jgi:hypothetical protein